MILLSNKKNTSNIKFYFDTDFDVDVTK